MLRLDKNLNKISKGQSTKKNQTMSYAPGLRRECTFRSVDYHNFRGFTQDKAFEKKIQLIVDEMVVFFLSRLPWTFARKIEYF